MTAKNYFFPFARNRACTEWQFKDFKAGLNLLLNKVEILKLEDSVSSVPASSNAAGIPGQTAYDDDYVYKCVATNKWIRFMGVKNF